MDNSKNIMAKIEGMLGLARRAGRITYGTDAVLKDILSGKSKAVFLSSDASERTQGKFKKTCDENGVPFVILPLTKETIGKAIGRNDTAVVTVSDKSFSDKLIELTGENVENPPQGGNGSGI